MGKVKTNRSAAKRYTLTGTGKVKRNKANSSHLLNVKSQKRKMNLIKVTLVEKTNSAVAKKLVPYI